MPASRSVHKGFSLDANGKHILAFRGSHSAAGNCAAALRAYQAVLPERPTYADAALELESNITMA